MINVSASVPHQLGQPTAIQCVHELVSSLTQKFPQQVHQVQLDMRGHRADVKFAAYGYVVQWQAEVMDSCVQLTGQLPDTAAPFQEKMLQAVTTRIEAALALAVRPARAA